MDKFINAEAFKRKLIDEKNFYPAIVARALEEMPAADVVEVVRCEKCKHGDVSTFSLSKDGEEYIGCYCSLKNIVMDIDCYCSSGERSDT